MSENMQARWFMALLVGWCVVIYVLSAQSTLPGMDGFTGQDKLVHMTAYTIMAWLFWRAFLPLAQARMAQPAMFVAVSAVVFCMLYGLSDEWHQSFVPGRMPDVLDWLADTLGALLLSTGYYRWHNRHRLDRMGRGI
jgi:VanZ family protein